MKIKSILSLLLILMFLEESGFAQSPAVRQMPDTLALSRAIDLSLPSWGPYSKRYIGISHIPDREKGLRLDFSVFPGFYRQRVEVPNVLFPSGYHPWEASPALDYFSFRHELEWKDQVYADISYSTIDANARLVRTELVNNTDQTQTLVLHQIPFLNYPEEWGYEVVLPPQAVWIDATSYRALKFARTRPQDDLVYNGWLRAEERNNAFVSGRAIGRGFGKDKGDWVNYDLELNQNLQNAGLLLRYKLAGGEKASFIFEDGYRKKIELELMPSAEFRTHIIELGSIPRGHYSFALIAEGGAETVIDGYVLAEVADMDAIKFSRKAARLKPDILAGPHEQSLLLKYPDVEHYYGLAWNTASFKKMEYLTQDLDVFLRRHAHTHNRTKIGTDDQGYFYDVFLNPLVVAPAAKKILYSVICSGTKKEVEAFLAEFRFGAECEAVYEKARQKAVSLKGVPAGETYRFSQEKMAATTLTNVIYPIYTRNQYILHHPPGRLWQSLYTWDSGFIGLGLSALDIGYAIEVLNQYVTKPEDQSAFVHHGTPLPVQVYLFQEIWNRTQDKALLAYFYPRLRKYHRFLAGRLGSSTTASLKSGLLKTWDYFYNSGGWDDYPPQKFVHQQQLTGQVAPVVNTAHAIRTAKILRMAALELGRKSDVAEYEKDIAHFTKALQKHSWDEESGYYGYVVHDREGNPKGILRHESGKNFNMGLGGAYPLVAGITTPKQKEKLLKHLKTRGALWSDIGLSAVDQSAPYYSNSGYWNGTVWMPHQWFFWKSMLDWGEEEFAYKIAHTGLDVWKKEVETSYHTFEHFIIETGRGAGWHQFSALSTPVMLWYGAYYRPGSITVGFDCWIKELAFNQKNTAVQATISLNADAGSKGPLVLVCLDPQFQYQVSINNQPVNDYRELHKGLLQIKLPVKESVKLEVKAISR